MKIFNQYTYLICQLKWQELLQKELQLVFDTIIVTCLLYASAEYVRSINRPFAVKEKMQMMHNIFSFYVYLVVS